MPGLSETLKMSVSAMQAQAERLRFVSENVANADTPGYQRKTASFETVVENGRRTGQVQTGSVRFDQTELTRIYDPSNPLADASGYYNGSNVDIVTEIADAREAQRSYEANLRMFDQARQMTRGVLELLRR